MRRHLTVDVGLVSFDAIHAPGHHEGRRIDKDVTAKILPFILTVGIEEYGMRSGVSSVNNVMIVHSIGEPACNLAILHPGDF